MKAKNEMVREAGVEPTTFGSGGRRSIQLSYSRVAVGKIRARPGLLKWILRMRRVGTCTKTKPNKAKTKLAAKSDMRYEL